MQPAEAPALELYNKTGTGSHVIVPVQELEALLTTYIQRGAGLESQILRAIGGSLPQVSSGAVQTRDQHLQLSMPVARMHQIQETWGLGLGTDQNSGIPG